MSRYKYANKKCPCGSNKKFKNCCINKLSEKELDEMYNRTIKECTDIDVEINVLEKNIPILERLTEFNKKSNSKNYYFNLFQTLVYSGNANKALEIYKLIENETWGSYLEIHIRSLWLKARYESCGTTDPINVFFDADNLFKSVKNIRWDPSTNISTFKSGALAESGRVMLLIVRFFEDLTEGLTEDLTEDLTKLENMKRELNTLIYQGKRTVKNISEKLIKAYKNYQYKDIDHYFAGMSFKISLALLSDVSIIEEKKAIAMMDDLINEKIKYGYFKGIANNFCELSSYYLKKKNYKQCIAYCKRDLALTKKFGSLYDQFVTYNNLTNIYIHCKQIGNAKKILSTLISINNKLKNEKFTITIDNIKEKMKEEWKSFQNNKEDFGLKSSCICKSGKAFIECCGEADFEYTDIDNVLNLNNLLIYSEKFDYTEDKLPELKLLLSDNNDNKTISWYKIKNEKGFCKIFEMINMAQVHINAAQNLLNNINTASFINETSTSLGVIILSISGIEAFLNQILNAILELPDFQRPKGFDSRFLKADNSIDMQRNTKITDKIDTLVNLLKKENKENKDTKKKVRDLKKLIQIRNELVHFKSQGFEQIIPNTPSKLIDNELRKEVNFRDLKNNWVLQITNEEFATWALKVCNNFLKLIKKNCYGLV